MLADEYLQPLDGCDLLLLALLPEPLEFGKPDRPGLTNEGDLLNVFVAQSTLSFRVKST